MADPTPYVPSYSYSGWQQNNPTRPLPADEVDNDFAKLRITTSELIQALREVRRSDGALNNGIVTADSLAPQLSIGFGFDGEWAAGVSYQTGDGVVYENAFYRANVQHAAAADAPPGGGGPWTLLFSIDDIVVAGALAMPVDTFTGDGSTTQFNLSFTPNAANNLIVSVGGIVQSVVEYTIDGNSIVFGEAPAAGYAIEVRGIATTASVVTPEDGSVTEAKLESTLAAKVNSALQPDDIGDTVGNIIGYDTLADLEAASIGATIDAVRTAGYTTAGDGGGALYRRISTPDPIEAWHVQSADGAWWEVVAGASAVALAAVGNGTADDEAAVSNYLDWLTANGIRGHLGQGTFKATILSVDAVNNFTLSGDGPHITTLKRDTDGGSFFRLNDSVGALLEDFSIDNDFETNADAGHGVTLLECANVRVRNVNISGIGNSDLIGPGTGILALPRELTGNVRNIVFQDMHLVAAPGNVNTVGTLIADGRYCRQNGIFVEGFTHFGAEYKEDTRYSLATDIIAYDCANALGYGQSTAGVDGCDYNVGANIVAHECEQAIVVGEGEGNLFANIIAKADTTATAYGVDHSSDSVATVVDNLLTSGAGIVYPARYRGSAARCFTAVASHDTASNIITLDVGATKNVTEVLHPGARTAIAGAINDVSGSGISGTNANVAYCQATGEWLGSLSAKFRWELGASSAYANAQSHRMGSDGNTILGLSSPGTASDNAGIQVNKAATTNYAAFVYVFGTDYWSLRAASTNIGRFAVNLWRPENDNATSLGLSGARFSVVYAGTGTINTSDEREKQDIIDASEDEAAIRAVRKIKIKRFRWKDAVAEKEDAARLHFGVIAQEVKEAFEAEGLDAFAYGLLCYDEWGEEPEIRDDEGNVTQEYRPAGNRFGVRYDELLALKIASYDN